MRNEIIKQITDDAYEQGINHALKVAKQVVARKGHKTIEAFLLDLSIELARLKIEMASIVPDKPNTDD